MSFILAEVLELMDIAACQGLKAANQFAIDGGSWKAAWPMTLMKDPYKGPDFGGSELELKTITGFIKANEDLKSKLWGGGEGYKGKADKTPEQGEESGDGEDGAWKKPWWKKTEKKLPAKPDKP
jgi:hypothetical protein